MTRGKNDMFPYNVLVTFLLLKQSTMTKNNSWKKELFWLMIPGVSPCGGRHGEITPATANSKQRNPLGSEARL